MSTTKLSLFPFILAGLIALVVGIPYAAGVMSDPFPGLLALPVVAGFVIGPLAGYAAKRRAWKVEQKAYAVFILCMLASGILPLFFKNRSLPSWGTALMCVVLCFFSMSCSIAIQNAKMERDVLV